jgi:hypothetical protein
VTVGYTAHVHYGRHTGVYSRRHGRREDSITIDKEIKRLFRLLDVQGAFRRRIDHARVAHQPLEAFREVAAREPGVTQRMKRGRMPETGNPQTEAGVTRGFDREFPQPLNRQVGKTLQRLPQPLVIETGTTALAIINTDEDKTEK